MKTTAAILALTAVGFLAACSDSKEMTRRETSTTTLSQPAPPPSIVEQKTTTQTERSD